MILEAKSAENAVYEIFKAKELTERLTLVGIRQEASTD